MLSDSVAESELLAATPQLARQGAEGSLLPELQVGKVQRPERFERQQRRIQDGIEHPPHELSTTNTEGHTQHIGRFGFWLSPV